MRNAVWLLLTLLVVIRYVTTRPVYSDGDVLRVSGTVLTEPVRYDYSQRIEVAGLTTFVDRFPEISYGDHIVLVGIFGDGELKNAEVESYAEGSNILFGVRQKIISFYNRVLPQPHNALVAGVVLGSKESISKGFRQDLIDSGTVHVVVASGMNVTLVAGFLLNSAVALLPRKKAVPFALFGVWAYVLLSGFNAPLVRAAIMGSIAFSAQAVGRISLALRALVLSALIMLIFNPRWISDLGFQLSFLATLSLILFEAKVHNLVRFVPIDIFRKDLSTTLSAQLGVLPLLVGVFGRVSPVSPIANTLVLWTIAPTMIIASIGGIIGLIFEPLGRAITLLVFPMTSWFIFLIDLLSI